MTLLWPAKSSWGDCWRTIDFTWKKPLKLLIAKFHYWINCRITRSFHGCLHLDLGEMSPAWGFNQELTDHLPWWTNILVIPLGSRTFWPSTPGLQQLITTSCCWHWKNAACKSNDAVMISSSLPAKFQLHRISKITNSQRPFMAERLLSKWMLKSRKQLFYGLCDEGGDTKRYICFVQPGVTWFCGRNSLPGIWTNSFGPSMLQ